MADANSFPTTLGPFTVGDHWRQRGGGVRRIVAVDYQADDDCQNSYPLLTVCEEGGEVKSHTSEGRVFSAKSISDFDLVEKIVPKRKAWVVFDPRDVADDTAMFVSLFGRDPGQLSSGLVVASFEFEVPNDGA